MIEEGFGIRYTPRTVHERATTASRLHPRVYTHARGIARPSPFAFTAFADFTSRSKSRDMSITLADLPATGRSLLAEYVRRHARLNIGRIATPGIPAAIRCQHTHRCVEHVHLRARNTPLEQISRSQNSHCIATTLVKSVGRYMGTGCPRNFPRLCLVCPAISRA